MIDSPKKRTITLEDRFSQKIVSCLSERTAELPYDISERLRAARVQALAQRKIAKTQTATSLISSGGSAALTWGSEETLGWWGRVGSIMPLIALVIGLLAISTIQDNNRTEELAEVDSALLTDELPPAAFADPGFVQFLKSTRQASTIQ